MLAAETGGRALSWPVFSPRGLGRLGQPLGHDPNDLTATSWRPAAARPIAGSSSAEGPSGMQKTIGRRPEGKAKGPGQQLGGQLAAARPSAGSSPK